MKFSRQPGIRLKITLAFAIVFTLLSLGLNLYSYNRIRQLIISDNNRYLLARAQSLLDKTEVNPVIIPLPDKNTSIKVFARHTKKRTLLFQSPGSIQQVQLPNTTGVSDTLNQRVAYVINSSEDNPAELVLAVSNTQLQSTLNYLLLLLILSTLLCVLISGIVSFALAKVFLSPLQRIISKTRNINAGQLSQRVPVKASNDELQELAETINAMLSRIETAQQQQQNFFASASHELKTPLAVMRAELELHLRQGEHINIPSQLEEISRLQTVVEEFLLISQIQAGQLKLHTTQFDLTDLCLKIKQQLQIPANAKSIDINLQFDQETENYTITADKEKIRLVLLNLLHNAIKYSQPNITIQFTAGRNQNQDMHIQIQNPTTQPIQNPHQLTQAFYRENPLQPGAGVGLWLSNQILNAHQATFTLTSTDNHFQALVSIPNL